MARDLLQFLCNVALNVTLEYNHSNMRVVELPPLKKFSPEPGDSHRWPHTSLITAESNACICYFPPFVQICAPPFDWRGLIVHSCEHTAERFSHRMRVFVTVSIFTRWLNIWTPFFYLRFDINCDADLVWQQKTCTQTTNAHTPSHAHTHTREHVQLHEHATYKPFVSALENN